ncbi:hypothetical protein CCH79_00018222 [Gambusia affinis]|uniref:Uncharacterized protein n=1 Tax=Gambusia affinis TaxID=33528 RepID=A0A315VGG2_GAMAF|nr:hypothetical protein CCH79_00018222 [Gambusia affinis]
MPERIATGGGERCNEQDQEIDWNERVGSGPASFKDDPNEPPRDRGSPPSGEKLKNCVSCYLSHMDVLGEDLGSLLGRVSAEDHQLDPLRDAVAHHDGSLQRRVVPHRTSHHVAAAKTLPHRSRGCSMPVSFLQDKLDELHLHKDKSREPD